MLDSAINSIKEIITQKSIRRTISIFTIVLIFCVTFESYTQYFSTNELAQKTNVISQISKLGDNIEASSKLNEIQLSLLSEYAEIEKRRDNPASTLFSLFLCFLKGAWPVLFVMWLILKKIKGAFAGGSILKEKFEEHKMALWLGLQGYSGLAWLATLLGVISALWNKSDNFFVSWFIFPVLSLVIFISVFSWALLLKTIIPKIKENA